MATVRLDVPTETVLKRLATQRGQTKSEVIRDAIARLATETEEEGKPLSAYHRLQPFLGVIDSGGQQLSTGTGQRLRQILEERQNARRSG